MPIPGTALERTGMTLPDGLQGHLEKGNVAPIYEWLEAGHIDARDSKGRTLLMLAAAMGSRELLDAMLERGANLELQQHQGTTALMFASFAGEQTIATRLVAARARIDARDKHGLIAQDYAKLHGHTQIV